MLQAIGITASLPRSLSTSGHFYIVVTSATKAVYVNLPSSLKQWTHRACHYAERRSGLMQRICSAAAAMVGLSLALGVAPSWAQRPPTNDTSDNMGNTAGGTGALTSSTPGNFNTAYGNAALRTNTGSFNTAVGTIALSFSNTGNNNTGVGNAALEINST